MSGSSRDSTISVIIIATVVMMMMMMLTTIIINIVIIRIIIVLMVVVLMMMTVISLSRQYPIPCVWEYSRAGGKWICNAIGIPAEFQEVKASVWAQ